MEGELKVKDYGCIDGQPQRSARYQENGYNLECMDKGVVQSDRRIDEAVL